MKINKKIASLAWAAALLPLVGCVENEADYKVFPDPDVAFNYNVDGDQYTLDYYVVSTIKFNNTSAKSGNFVWDFGDGETSTEVSPTHKYKTAGEYRVRLTLDGASYAEAPIYIFDITPQLTVAEQSTEIVEINNTKVSFNITLPNPENLKCRYEWTFPEGTLDANGQPLVSFVGESDENGNVEYPGDVSFKHIGSQKINIRTYFDLDGENRRLQDAYLNVQVGSPVEAPTLYYAQRDGNIKAIKLVDPSQLPQGTKNMPFDMGVKSGNNPFNIVYGETSETSEEGETTTQGWIYILDAGKQYYYINDENGVLGDGLITAMKVDGTGVNTVITNVGCPAFNDPFQGQVYDGMLYYTDRGTGISAIDQTARGQVQAANKSNNRGEYFVQNDLVPYYNRGISYGAIHAGFQRLSNGVWYWAKNYSGNGIFRFKESDIYGTAALAAKADLPYPIICSGIKLRSFVIDEQRKQLYIWRLATNEGLNVYNLPADNATVGQNDAHTKILMDADPINTTADEGVYTSQLALDKETGRVYFGFRPAASDNSKLGTGIVYYDPNTKKCQRFGDTNDAILGMTINPNKTHLF